MREVRVRLCYGLKKERRQGVRKRERGRKGESEAWRKEGREGGRGGIVMV